MEGEIRVNGKVRNPSLTNISGLTQETTPDNTDLVAIAPSGGGANVKTELKDLGTDYYDNGSKGVTDSPYALNLDNGNVHKITITGNITLSISNAITGAAHSITLIIVNGGASTITWNMGLDTAGGTAFSLTASGTDTIELLTTDAGTNTFGYQSGEDMQ